MQIVVWYPAKGPTQGVVDFRHYVELSAGKLSIATPTARAQAVEDFAAVPLSHDIARSWIDLALELPMDASTDLQHASGRFPLVLFLHASPWTASVMSEYLASHGLVVAAIESKGATAVPYKLSPENLDAMVRDAAYVVTRMRREPYVSNTFGAIGMSNGSVAAVAMQLSGPKPRAIVSLDGGIGEPAGGTYMAERTGSDPAKFTAPILHLYTADNPHLDLEFLRSYSASPRMLVQVDHLRHGDFLAYGALERVMPGAFGTAPAASSLGFEVVCRYTEAFLRSTLVGDGEAREFMSATPATNGVPAGLVEIERLPARRVQ